MYHNIDAMLWSKTGNDEKEQKRNNYMSNVVSGPDVKI